LNQKFLVDNQELPNLHKRLTIKSIVITNAIIKLTAANYFLIVENKNEVSRRE